MKLLEQNSSFKVFSIFSKLYTMSKEWLIWKFFLCLLEKIELFAVLIQVPNDHLQQSNWVADKVLTRVLQFLFSWSIISKLYCPTKIAKNFSFSWIRCVGNGCYTDWKDIQNIDTWVLYFQTKLKSCINSTNNNVKSACFAIPLK